jgi:hypothetical protein
MLTHLGKRFLAFVKPKFHYSVPKRLPLDPISSHLNPIHTISFKLHFNIMLSSTSRSLKWSFLSDTVTKDKKCLHAEALTGLIHH